MSKFYEKRENSVKYSGHAANKVKEHVSQCRSMYVLPSTASQAQICVSARESHIVDLGLMKCTCLKMQDCLIPCPHACAFLLESNIDQVNVVDNIYLCSTYKQCYKVAIVPLCMEDLSGNTLALPRTPRDLEGDPIRCVFLISVKIRV